MQQATRVCRAFHPVSGITGVLRVLVARMARRGFHTCLDRMQCVRVERLKRARNVHARVIGTLQSMLLPRKSAHM
ncbi:hypothetical protein [Xanthomonas pisi]|uniref:hypothetical protein n=1 Tax=Xanthomonas pisi TaxID=56457 RepID=UPI0012EE3FA0|nr:hypothetical protein [Xanthomonas pisi]